MSENEKPYKDIKIRLISFGAKHGPLDLVPYSIVACNKIRNPWLIPELRKLTGKDKKVQDLVGRCGGGKALLDKYAKRMTIKYKSVANYDGPALPTSTLDEFTILAFKCHGGKHRSVAMVELLAKRLVDEGVPVEIIHRDIDK